MGGCYSKNVGNRKTLQQTICASNANLATPIENPPGTDNVQRSAIQSSVAFHNPTTDITILILSQDVDAARKLRNDLSNLVVTIQTCNDAVQCDNYLSAIENQSIFMVIMAPWDDTFFTICSYIQISRGYFLSTSSSSYTEYRANFSTEYAPKYVHMCNKKEFISQITHDVRVWESLKSPVYFMNGHRSEDSSPSSFWHCLLTQVLLRMPSDSMLARQEMFKFFRTHYEALPENSLRITEMEQGYTNDRAIRYYTSSAFVYSIVNRILRSGNIDHIFQLRCFLKDLDSQIRALHRTYITGMSRPLTVYRGQSMTEDDFANFRRNVGTYVSFNNFLSTSLDRDVALMFINMLPSDIDASQRFRYPQNNARDMKFVSEQKDIEGKLKAHLQTTITGEISAHSMVGVLLEIKLGPDIVTQACFADISDASAFGDMEREVLFSMNSVFRVDEILELEGATHIKHIKLSLANDSDVFPLQNLSDYMRDQWGRNTDTITLGDCFSDRGDYDRAAYYYAKQLDTPFTEYDRGILYNNLGWLYECREMYDIALSNYEKALYIQQKQIDEYPLDLASTYNNMGIIYYQKEDLRAASSNFEKSLKIKRSIQAPLNISTTASIAITLSNTGLVEHKNGNFTNAFNYYNEAYQKLAQILPKSHLNLATTLNNMGTADMDLGHLEDALKTFEKVLIMRKAILPENHPDIAWSHIKIGRVYEKQSNYFDAKMNYDLALQIQHRCLLQNHSDIAVTLNRLGSVELLRGAYDSALELFEKALEIYDRMQSKKTTDVAMVHNNFGLTYTALRLYDQAQTSCETALELLLKTWRPNHPSLARIYGNLARIYDYQKDFKRAYDCNKRAIEIGLQALPPNYGDLMAYQLHADLIKAKLPEPSKPTASVSIPQSRVGNIRIFRKWKISFSRTD